MCVCNLVLLIVCGSLGGIVYLRYCMVCLVVVVWGGCFALYVLVVLWLCYVVVFGMCLCSVGRCW